MKNYKVIVRFQAIDRKDAENFVVSMRDGDWLEHLGEVKDWTNEDKSNV